MEIFACVSGEIVSATPTFILAIFKVEAMEVMSFYEVAKSFRFKWGETRITDLTVSEKTERQAWKQGTTEGSQCKGVSEETYA